MTPHLGTDFALSFVAAKDVAVAEVITAVRVVDAAFIQLGARVVEGTLLRDALQANSTAVVGSRAGSTFRLACGVGDRENAQAHRPVATTLQVLATVRIRVALVELGCAGRLRAIVNARVGYAAITVTARRVSGRPALLSLSSAFGGAHSLAADVGALVWITTVGIDITLAVLVHAGRLSRGYQAQVHDAVVAALQIVTALLANAALLELLCACSDGEAHGVNALESVTAVCVCRACI